MCIAFSYEKVNLVTSRQLLVSFGYICTLYLGMGQTLWQWIWNYSKIMVPLVSQEKGVVLCARMYVTVCVEVGGWFLQIIKYSFILKPEPSQNLIEMHFEIKGKNKFRDHHVARN